MTTYNSFVLREDQHLVWHIKDPFLDCEKL